MSGAKHGHGHHGHHGHHGQGHGGHHGEHHNGESLHEEWVRYFSEPLRATEIDPFSPMYGHPLRGPSIDGFGFHLPEFAGELAIKHDASGNVIITHQPHGDIGDENEYEPNYGAGSTGKGMDWDMNMSQNVGPFGSYGLSFGDEVGDDMGCDDFGAEGAEHAVGYGSERIGPGGTQFGLDGNGPGGTIFGDEESDPDEEDPVLNTNFDPELSPDGVDTFDSPERARTLRNPVIPFGYPERPNFGLDDEFYSGFGPAGIFGDDGFVHCMKG